MHRYLQYILVQIHNIYLVCNFWNEANNDYIVSKIAKKRNYNFCKTNNNINKSPLHGLYTPRPGGASTKAIDAADLLKKIKRSFFESHVHEIWTSLPPQDVQFLHM